MTRTKAFDEDAALLRAMALFWEKGYAAASLAQLTACMGISRQSLYDTYGDKRGLFLKALDRYCAFVGGRLLPLLSGESPGLAEIKTAIAAVIDFLLAYPKPRACLMANSAMEVAPHDSTVAGKVAAFHRTLEAAFATALGNARARGEIANPTDPAILARYLVATVNGMAVAAKAGATRENLQQIATVALSALQTS